MTEEIKLIRPTEDLHEEYLHYYDEWIKSGEDLIPWVIKKDPTNFKKMIQSLHDAEKGKNLPAGWVRDSTYWLVIDSNKLLGVVNIRHQLTEQLINTGGHIGYGIRPSQRRKGYANKLLSLTLQKTDLLGINKVLVVCDEWNEPSRRTILNNGGIQDLNFIEEDGNVINRFWIDRTVLNKEGDDL